MSVATTGALHHELAAGPERGVARSVHLFRLFRREPTEPEPFYHYLAADTLRHIGRFTRVAGATVVDVGGGPGYVAEAFTHAGATPVVLEYSAAELELHERSPDVAVRGDGQALPFRDGSVQIVHSSNVLEHVPNWPAMLSEMLRILEPRTGLGYLTFTPWYSPWGGHETSPWHYLGGERAVARYQRKTGQRPKNEYGTSLYRLTVNDVQGWFAHRDDLEVLWVGPRYWPEWARPLVKVPAVREVAAWNVVVVFRRRPDRGAQRP